MHSVAVLVRLLSYSCEMGFMFGPEKNLNWDVPVLVKPLFVPPELCLCHITWQLISQHIVNNSRISWWWWFHSNVEDVENPTPHPLGHQAAPKCSTLCKGQSVDHILSSCGLDPRLDQTFSMSLINFTTKTGLRLQAGFFQCDVSTHLLYLCSFVVCNKLRLDQIEFE